GGARPEDVSLTTPGEVPRLRGLARPLLIRSPGHRTTREASMKRKAAALAELAPYRFPPCAGIRVVGITADGAVPLVSDKPLGRPATIPPPAVSHPHPPDPLAGIGKRLCAEAGLEIEEIVVMSRYGIPIGARGHATIVLAPRVRIAACPPTAIAIVPLAGVLDWLEGRKREGARVDPMVRVGLIL